MGIPQPLLEKVRRLVEEKSHQSIPFNLRGISINCDLIGAAIDILNSASQKTLPQNCRNDIRSRTPDGLDRRIKEYRKNDTRTANIISDVLADAGIVELVDVNNPETGRAVKGTRLLQEWTWELDGDTNSVTAPKPIITPIQPAIQVIKSEKRLESLNLNREEYLNNPHVQSFIAWLEKHIDESSGFSHQYDLIKADFLWHCTGLYQAYEKYWWPYSMACPVQGKRVVGTSFKESLKYMNVLADSFRTAIRNKDQDITRKCALAMLTWGGVLNFNEERIRNMKGEVCDYFSHVQETLNLAKVQLGKHDGIHINSGFTKLYFLLIDDFIMYDGRVGAALGLLGRLYAQEKGLDKIPEAIEFSFGSGKTSGAQKLKGNRRNPSKAKYVLPEFTGDRERHLQDNIKASWLLKELADKTTSGFARLPQEPPLNERLTAIQSALFMIGYDVQGHNWFTPVFKKAPNCQ